MGHELCQSQSPTLFQWMMNREGNYHSYHSVIQPKTNSNILSQLHLLLFGLVGSELLCLLRICFRALVCLPSLAVFFGNLSMSPKSCLDIAVKAVIHSRKSCLVFRLIQYISCIVTSCIWHWYWGEVSNHTGLNMLLLGLLWIMHFKSKHTV